MFNQIDHHFSEKVTLKRMWTIISMSFQLKDGYFDEMEEGVDMGRDTREKVITSKLDNMMERMLTFIVFFFIFFIFTRLIICSYLLPLPKQDFLGNKKKCNQFPNGKSKTQDDQSNKEEGKESSWIFQLKNSAAVKLTSIFHSIFVSMVAYYVLFLKVGDDTMYDVSSSSFFNWSNSINRYNQCDARE